MLIVESTTTFSDRFYRPGGEQIGVLTTATWIHSPRNSAVPIGTKDATKFELCGKTYHLEYEVSNLRALGGNDIRYFLMEGDRTLATGAALHEESKNRWEVQTYGQRYELANDNSWRGMRFVLTQNRTRVGEVKETTRLLAVTRTYEVTAPSTFEPAILAFLYYLAARRTFN